MHGKGHHEKHRRREERPQEESVEGQEQSGESLEDQIRSAEEEARKHYDKLLRVMAEFENFKKRMQKEREDHLQYSNEKLMADLLPVLDDLDRVIDHIPDDGAPEVTAIAKGIEMVRKNMIATLAKYGLKEVEALGHPFDPGLHEAVSTAASDEFEHHTVIDVHRKGYILNDRLLRAAMVTVAS